jgi:hypothetical protein
VLLTNRCVVLATIVDLCKKTPTKNYTFPKDQQIYGAAKITLSSSANSTTSTTPSASMSPSSSQHAIIGSTGLSKGALAGIVLGVLVLIIAVLVGVLMLFRRKKNNDKAMAVSGNGETVHEVQGDYGYQPVGGQKEGYAQQRPVEMGQKPRVELMGRQVAAELGDGAVGR